MTTNNNFSVYRYNIMTTPNYFLIIYGELPYYFSCCLLPHRHDICFYLSQFVNFTIRPNDFKEQDGKNYVAGNFYSLVSFTEFPNYLVCI